MDETLQRYAGYEIREREEVMCRYKIYLTLALLSVAVAANAAPSRVALVPGLPNPVFEGTPIDVRSPHREAYRGCDVPPKPLMVPAGTQLFSRGCRVSSSDRNVERKWFDLVTDGDKQYTQFAYLELAPGVQWVQIDLASNVFVEAVCIWRERPESIVYRDTVVQISDNPGFSKNVTTLFNNDYDNSAKRGKGSDKEYLEDYFGRRISGRGIKARYLRVYSNGSTSSPYNHFTEIEVYGSAVKTVPEKVQDSDSLGFRNPVVVQGATGSIVDRVETAVIVPGIYHDDLWVNPEFFITPDNPPGVELRIRSTDRRGLDQHTLWHYFKSDDLCGSLQPIDEGTATLWDRKDLVREDFSASSGLYAQLPEKLGHTDCAAFVYLDSATILQAFTTKKGKVYSIQSVAARIEGDKFVPLYISNSFSNSKGRGLYEPHIAVFRKRCYMTARCEDDHGYILTSDDRGRSWSKPRPWTWDDGEIIPMNQTMTKLLSHPEGLVLVYTRKREDNQSVFRNRSPLHCADIDPVTLTIKRSSERIIVPNKGNPIGNFWVWPVNENESWVTVTEWPRDGRRENGDTWLAKIFWK